MTPKAKRKGKKQAAESVCPTCKGLGYVRANAPVGDPDFGKLVPCSCRLAELGERRVVSLRNL
ncbi:MAG: hypothetical protein E3J64_08335, partial [Anaerolineales bacterium]